MGSLFSWADAWLWLVALVVLASVVYTVHDRSFFLTDLFYKFPFIGKIRLYSRDYSKHSRADWLNVEMRLCRDFRPHVTAISRAQFANNVAYLKKSYDDARTPTPLWAILGLLVLIIMEGLGFGYLLGSILSFEGSENTRLLLTVAVTTALSLILLVVNHNAGHELFRWKLLRSCFQSYQMEGGDHYTSTMVSLDQDQSLDDRERPHVQCANRVVTRVDDQGSLTWPVIALVLTIVIAVGSTMLRDATMHVAELQTAPSFLQLFSEGHAQPAAPDVSEQVLRAARRAAAWVGFIMLATLFVVTQFVGIEVGRRWGFAGRQSAKAYAATHGCADYDTYFEPVQRRINIASARLETLQQMLERGAPSPLPFHKTFADFIGEECARGATDLQEPCAVRVVSEPPGEPQRALPPPDWFSEGPAGSPVVAAPVRRRRRFHGWLAAIFGRRESEA